jgi:hypothetical protein
MGNSMTIEKTIERLKFFTGKFSSLWGVRADVAGTRMDFLPLGYAPLPAPRVVFSVYQLSRPCQAWRVIEELSLYERKTMPVCVEIAAGDVREIAGVAADEKQQVFLLTMPT